MSRYGNHVLSQNDNAFERGVRHKLNGTVSTHNTTFDNMPAEKVNRLVKQEARSNWQQRADAISKADSFSFQVAHPEFIRSEANIKLVNYQLETWGITNPTYPDFQRAYDALRESNLLAIDKQKDRPLNVFVGSLTGRTFDNLDEFIAAERQVAIHDVTPSSDEEMEFANLSSEQLLPMLKQLEKEERQKQDAPRSGSAGDAWITLHPEYKDTVKNGKLMRHQLAQNGVLEDVATIKDFETAYQQISPSGLLDLNQSEITKQLQAELKQRAADAVAEVGTVFDQTTEDEMYEMDLEEVKRRANAVMGR